MSVSSSSQTSQPAGVAGSSLATHTAYGGRVAAWLSDAPGFLPLAVFLAVQAATPPEAVDAAPYSCLAISAGVAVLLFTGVPELYSLCHRLWTQTDNLARSLDPDLQVTWDLRLNHPDLQARYLAHLTRRDRAVFPWRMFGLHIWNIMILQASLTSVESGRPQCEAGVCRAAQAQVVLAYAMLWREKGIEMRRLAGLLLHSGLLVAAVLQRHLLEECVQPLFSKTSLLDTMLGASVPIGVMHLLCPLGIQQTVATLPASAALALLRAATLLAESHSSLLPGDTGVEVLLVGQRTWLLATCVLLPIVVISMAVFAGRYLVLQRGLEDFLESLHH